MTTIDPSPSDICEEEHDVLNTFDIAIAAVDVLLCLLAVVCNGAVVIILYKKPKLRNKSNSHLMNLVIGDIVYCLTLPLTVANFIMGGWIFGNIICQIHGFVILWVVLGIEFNFPILAIYRLIVMSRSQNRFAELYKSQTLALHLVTWLLAGLCAFPPLIGWGRMAYCDRSRYCFLSFSDSESYVSFFLAISTILPLFTMTFCYTKVIVTVRQSSKRVQSAANNMLSASVASLAVCDDQNAIRVPSPAPSSLYTDRDFLPLPSRQPLPKSNVNQRRSSLASTTGGRTRDNARRFSLASIASSTLSNVRPSEQRLGRSLALISASYLITWVPVVALILQATFKPNIPIDLYVQMIHLFLFLHVAANPLVYGLLTDPFRSILIGVLRRGRMISQETQRWVPPSVATGTQQSKAGLDNTTQSLKPAAWKESTDPALPSQSGYQQKNYGTNVQPLMISPVSVLSASSDDAPHYMTGIEDYRNVRGIDKLNSDATENSEPKNTSDC